MELKAPPHLKGKVQEYFIDIRADDDISDGFSGYASTFWMVDSYRTAVAPGAFTRTLKTRGERIPILYQHDPGRPIGRPKSLKQDKLGLAFDAAISTGTNAGAEAMTLLRDGVPLGMSFGFQTMKKRSAEEDDPLDFSQMPQLKRDDVEIITDAKLWEISLVTFPANEAASITAIRSDLRREAFHSLLDAIEADDLSDEDARFMDQIVLAWNQRPGPAAIEQHATPEMARRAHALSMLTLLTADAGYLMETDQWLTN